MVTKLQTIKEYIDNPKMDIYESAEKLETFIKQLKDINTYPYGFTTDTPVWKDMNVVDPHINKTFKTVSFVTNNYLGLTQHPEVKKAAIDAIDKYGTGTCAAPPIGGYIDLHEELEQKIAKLHGQEDALLYTSGYTANIGVFQNLFTKSDLVLADMFVHASIYDGLKNNTNLKIFKHNDMNYLELILKREQGKHRNLAIVVDGVYSQDGDLPKLPEICQLAKKYGAKVIVDDAHGAGVMGTNGKGTLDHFNLENEIDLITGTFSKSMGTTGGYAAGSRKVIQYLRHFSRSNTFSASLAPPSAAAAAKAIDIFTTEPHHIEKLWGNTKHIKTELKKHGFDIGHSETPITPVMIRDDEKATFTARKMLERGIYVVPATYPAVKLKDSRFRVNITAQHETEDLDLFLHTLVSVDEDFNLGLRKHN